MPKLNCMYTTKIFCWFLFVDLKSISLLLYLILLLLVKLEFAFLIEKIVKINKKL